MTLEEYESRNREIDARYDAAMIDLRRQHEERIRGIDRKERIRLIVTMLSIFSSLLMALIVGLAWLVWRHVA